MDGRRDCRWDVVAQRQSIVVIDDRENARLFRYTSLHVSPTVRIVLTINGNKILIKADSFARRFDFGVLFANVLGP